MSYKRLIPCIIYDSGMAIRWFNDPTVVSNDIVSLAKRYSKHGADELIIFDVSEDYEDHKEMIDLIKRIHSVIRIPMIVGGNIRSVDDVEEILRAGAKRAMLNFSNDNSKTIMEEASNKYGSRRIAVSLNDFDSLFKNQHLINRTCSEIVFMHRLDLNSVMNITDIPCIIVTDTMEKDDLFEILKCPGVKGISGKYLSQTKLRFEDFKKKCEAVNIKMTSFESVMDFSEFKLNSDGLIPVVVQHYKTEEVLMLAYMDEEAYYTTIKTGKMTYYSRSRKCQWIKGETSGHYQYVKSLTIDCDKDTILAKVDQIGPACHTGSPTCFFRPLVGSDCEESNPLRIFEDVYHELLHAKAEEKESLREENVGGLFNREMDGILKILSKDAIDLIFSTKNSNEEEMVRDMSDFLFHAMILMVEKDIPWEEILKAVGEKQI